MPSAGQNRRVPVFGALDAMTGEVSAMITAQKRSGEFLEFLDWLLHDIYADRDQVPLTFASPDCSFFFESSLA